MCAQANNAGRDRGWQILRDRSGFTTDGTDSSWADADFEPIPTQGSLAERGGFFSKSGENSVDCRGVQTIAYKEAKGGWGSGK
jgi:hypothetical protein